MVPKAEFRSYYGLPVIKEPVWGVRDVAGYLFFGGLAGASSALAASAELSGRHELARAAKTAAAGAIGLSALALVHDLGRPARFHHMLRVFKPTSPMSVGSWLLTAYGPAAGVAAASAVTGLLPGVGRAATVAAAVTGPGVAAYTAALLADTAVPAWHDAHPELPYLFVSSAATAAGGLGLMLARTEQADPARNLAMAGAAAEITVRSRMLQRLGPGAEPYQSGRAGRLLDAAEILTVSGLTAAAIGGRNRVLAAMAGAALVASSALTRFGVFYAGRASARDPKYTINPQKDRIRAAGLPQAQDLPAGRHGAGLSPLPPPRDRAQDHPGPQPENDQIDDHLPGDHQPGRVGGRGDVTEPDGGEHGDSEVQRVGVVHRLAEVAGRDAGQHEVGAGEQQQEQRDGDAQRLQRPQPRVP
jgi:Polysulphide reductase, NrfD